MRPRDTHTAEQLVAVHTDSHMERGWPAGHVTFPQPGDNPTRHLFWDVMQSSRKGGGVGRGGVPGPAGSGPH